MSKPKKDPAPETVPAPEKPRVTYATTQGGLTVDGAPVPPEPAAPEPPVTESGDPHAEK